MQDDIVVKAGKLTHVQATWVPESAGTELWRIGVPDKSAGESLVPLLPSVLLDVPRRVQERLGTRHHPPKATIQ